MVGCEMVVKGDGGSHVFFRGVVAGDLGSKDDDAVVQQTSPAVPMGDVLTWGI